MAEQDTGKHEEYVDENQIGALGNQDQTSTKANQSQISDNYLYSIEPDKDLAVAQNDQDLADNPDEDYNDEFEGDDDGENDDQYDIAGGAGLYGTGDYGNQGGPSKPASDRSSYGTKTSQDQNGNQQ